MNSAALVLSRNELAVLKQVCIQAQESKVGVDRLERLSTLLEAVEADQSFRFSPDELKAIDEVFTAVAAAELGLPAELNADDQASFRQVKAAFAAAAVD